LEYIQPGQPQKNAYIERFNRTARYEWLSQFAWDDLNQVQHAATQWMWFYNHQRPHMALGGFTPKQRLAMTAESLLLNVAKNGGITSTLRYFVKSPMN